MYPVGLINLITGEKFTKVFDSPFLCRNFINKCKHSDKVKIIFCPDLGD